MAQCATVPVGYVDLGLPSGTYWKESNESGFYNYDNAVSKFGDKLPTKEQLERYTENLDGYCLKRAVFTGIINPFNGDVEIENSNIKMLWEFCPYAEISKRIKEIANKTNKLTQEQFADMLKVSRQSVSKWEMEQALPQEPPPTATFRTGLPPST